MFKTKDPIGNVITLTRNCWKNHILVFHPVMENEMSKVKDCMENPDYIFQSKRNKGSFLYFKHFPKLEYGNKYIMVAVERKTGYVQSSYPVYNLKKGGEIIWKKE